MSSFYFFTNNKSKTKTSSDNAYMTCELCDTNLKGSVLIG